MRSRVQLLAEVAGWAAVICELGLDRLAHPSVLIPAAALAFRTPLVR